MTYDVATIMNVRPIKNSELIARMNPEVLVELLGGDTTQSEIAALVGAIAAEIDRRIPIPTEDP